MKKCKELSCEYWKTMKEDTCKYFGDKTEKCSYIKPNKKTKDAMKEAREIGKENNINLADKVEEFYKDFFIGGGKCYEDANSTKNKSAKKKIRKPTGKIDKETFITVMNLIIEQDKMNEKFDDALALINSSWTITEADEHMRKAVWKILEIFFNEYELDNLQWWLYEDVEKVFFEQDKNGKYIKKYPVKTLEQLYDYIMMWRKKK